MGNNPSLDGFTYTLRWATLTLLPIHLHSSCTEQSFWMRIIRVQKVDSIFVHLKGTSWVNAIFFVGKLPILRTNVHATLKNVDLSNCIALSH